MTDERLETNADWIHEFIAGQPYILPAQRLRLLAIAAQLRSANGATPENTPTAAASSPVGDQEAGND